MAYETTSVPIAQSQEAIRKLVMSNGGSGVAFICQPPVEGFEVLLPIDGKTYRVRLAATVKTLRSADAQAQEVRRVWRVLFYHMKALYEASRSGVLEFREMILPYVVAADGRTIAQHILPKLEQAVGGNVARLLPAGKDE